MTVPASHRPMPEPRSSDRNDIELAVRHAEPDELDAALRDAGASLLFDIKGGPDSPYVAAVAIGDGADRQFLIVTRPAGGDVHVEPAEESQSPLARLVPSFAAVMERWPAAA